MTFEQMRWRAFVVGMGIGLIGVIVYGIFTA